MNINKINIEKNSYCHILFSLGQSSSNSKLLVEQTKMSVELHIPDVVAEAGAVGVRGGGDPAARAHHRGDGVGGALARGPHGGDGKKLNLNLRETSPGTASQLHQELLAPYSGIVREESDLPGLRSDRGGRHLEAMADQPGVKNNRSTGVLPRELHQVLHSPVLGRPGPLGGVLGPEALLLQHGRDGDGSGAVEARGVHGANREVDGGAEEGQDLRAGLIAAVPAGVRGTRGAHRAQVEPARAGRG